jgi:hypothetical protein
MSVFVMETQKKARTGEGGLNLTMNYAFSSSILKEDNAGYLTQDAFHDNPTYSVGV